MRHVSVIRMTIRRCDDDAVVAGIYSDCSTREMNQESCVCSLGNLCVIPLTLLGEIPTATIALNLPNSKTLRDDKAQLVCRIPARHVCNDAVFWSVCVYSMGNMPPIIRSHPCSSLGIQNLILVLILTINATQPQQWHNKNALVLFNYFNEFTWKLQWNVQRAQDL